MLSFCQTVEMTMICLIPGGSGNLGVREPDHHQMERGHFGVQGTPEVKNR